MKAPAVARAAVVALAMLAAGSGAAWSGETPAAALARGDSAWAEGRLRDARAAYEAVLAADSTSVRANYKLAVLAARDDRLGPALTLIRRARAVEPADPELARTEARIVAWSGNYRAADSLYTWVIALEPDNVEGRLGLARLRLWEGRRDEAAAELDRALRLDPAGRDARGLQRELRAGTRPDVELGLVFASDSDRNVSWSRTVATSTGFARGLRGLVNGGSLSASDPALAGSRTLGEAGFDLVRGSLELVAAGGVRWLSPRGSSGRSEPCYRGSLSWRAAPAVVLGAGAAHYPLDETARLIGQRLDLDELEASLEASLGPAASLSAGGGLASFSDGNRRTSGVVALMRALHKRVSVGVLARVQAYAERGVGYFSPDRFGMAETRATMTWARQSWSGRAGAGLGVQQIGLVSATQSEWHAEGRLAHRWGPVSRVELSAGASNSANSSTTGAYRYLSSALTVRVGF